MLASSANSCWSGIYNLAFLQGFWHLCIFFYIEMCMNFLLELMAGNWISCFHSISFTLLLGLQCCKQTTCFVFNILLFFIKCIFLQGSHISDIILVIPKVMVLTVMVKVVSGIVTSRSSLKYWFHVYFLIRAPVLPWISTVFIDISDISSSLLDKEIHIFFCHSRYLHIDCKCISIYM